MLPDVAYPTVAEPDRPQPPHEAGGRRQRDEHKPEPDEDVDLLVEKVDGQDALDGVRQDGAHLSNAEVAQSNSRKARRSGVHGLSDDKVVYDFDTVQVVVGSEEQVQQKQLQGNVAEVEDFCHHVQRQQIVAVAVTARQAEVACQEVLQADTASAAVLALVVQVVVEMPDHVFNGLVAALRVQRVLDRVGRLHEVVNVDAGTFAEHLPDDRRQVEQESLDQQHDRHPLVVTQVLLDGTLLAGDYPFRQVVGVGNPADLYTYDRCANHVTGIIPAVSSKLIICDYAQWFHP